MNRRLLAALAAAALLVLGATGCAGTPGAATASPDATASQGATTLTVFAAASLREVFTELGQTFEAEHPGVTVAFAFAGSSDLAAQLQQGAPADVFASADTATMGRLVADALVGGPVDFASNTLTIAVPPGNPAGVASLADLAADDVQLVVCAPQVPCGGAATTVAAVADVDLRPVSEEQSVTDVLTKVIAGEADAGLVYVTDARAAGDRITAIPFPEAAHAVNTYPIAVLDDAAQPGLARQFVALVTGTLGQQALTKAGFGTP